MRPEYFENEQPIPKNPPKKPAVFKQPQPKIILPTKRPSKNKPSSQTTNFLKEARTKKPNNSNNEEKAEVEILVNNNSDKSQTQESNSMSNDACDNKPVSEPSKNFKTSIKEKLKPPVIFDLEEECISNEIDNAFNDVIIEVEDPKNKPKNSENTKKTQIDVGLKKEVNSNEIDPQKQADLNMQAEKEAFEAIKSARAEHLARNAKESQDLIEKYLQEGPLVYELYSILNHSGGAYGGHYFNFTKSFEDGKWYHFDDTSVREIDVDEIGTKIFGGINRSATAYMLMYRQVDCHNQTKDIKLEIPSYINEIVQAEKAEEERIYEEKCELLKQLTVKVYYKLEVKLIPIRTTNTYNDLLSETVKAYNIQTDIRNCRIRLYAAQTDTLLDTYHGKENETLESLKINNYKTLALEIKTSEEVFEEYDDTKTTIRVVLWSEEIVGLESLNLLNNNQNYVRKINCFKYSTLENIHEEVSKIFGIPQEKVLIYKKVISSGISVSQLLTNPEKMSKTILEMVLMENTLLYVDILEGESQTNRWQEEFDKEANRYTIKHNNPAQPEVILKDMNQENDEYQYTVVIDARQTLAELKYKICNNLGLDPNEIIIKRGGKLGIELKDLNSVVSSHHFISGSSVYLEFGKPSIPGQFRILFSIAKPTNLLCDNYFHSFEDFMELPVPGEYTASKVNEYLS